jgi:RNA-directed DNA polymerase
MAKWLKAWVWEDGQWSETKQGMPQGAVVSSLLANVYLHYVFDLWADAWRRKVARGDVIIVRYADDLSLGGRGTAISERGWQEKAHRMYFEPAPIAPAQRQTIVVGHGIAVSLPSPTKSLDVAPIDCKELAKILSESHQDHVARGE